MTLDDLKLLKTGKNRLLGVDFGDKTIGLSLSDKSWMLATPLKTIQRTGFKTDSVLLQKLIEAEEVAALVIGLPVSMDGARGPQAEKVIKYFEKFSQLSDSPQFFWDERLSTVAVERVMLEADLSRKKRKKVVDRAAASYILQGVLDGL